MLHKSCETPISSSAFAGEKPRRTQRELPIGISSFSLRVVLALP
jgi:hypothetical protein